MSILFDLDGVFYQGGQPVEGGAEVAAWVKKYNIAHLFITNTSSVPRKSLVTRLAKFGIHTDETHILTPAVAAASWLKKNAHTHSIALFIPEATQIEFEGFSLWHGNNEPVEAVIVGDLGKSWTFDILNQAFRLLMQQPQPQLIALGMTRYWQAEDGLRLDVAPFVAALEHATGIQAQVIGKPASAFYQAALDILKTEPEETIMVGDDIRGDVAGAQSAGMQGVLVKTGKYRPEDMQQGIQPNAILNSIIDLPDWWRKQANINYYDT